ncbi:hypothetical protein, partial [Bradyrhizobium sp.]|uniref:hypothetical protein n=1 Tax=Bradyrhizobium sp. TaxID=376 RepID=UPI00391A4D94
MIFASFDVILVEICVAWVSLASTADWIRAVQSIVLVVLVPDVVSELLELVVDEEEDDDVVLLVLEVALLTVIRRHPPRERPGRRRAGPAEHDLAEQLQEV